MHEDRILELIRQHRDHQRSLTRSLQQRGQFVIVLVALIGAGMVSQVSGNMAEVWGSPLLAGLFVIVVFLLLNALMYATATVFPLDGRHLFHAGRSSRARGWDRWLTEKGFEGRPLASFRTLVPDEEEEPEPEAPEEGAESEEPEASAPAPVMSADERTTFQRVRLSAFLARTLLDGQTLDLSVDPVLRAEVNALWETWFVAERCAGLLRRAIGAALLALVLGGVTSIQISEEVASSTQSSAAGGKGGKAGKAGGALGGGGLDGGKSGKGGKAGLDGSSGLDGGKSGKGGKAGGALGGGLEGGKSGKGGKAGGLDGSGGLEGGKAGKGGKAGGALEGGALDGAGAEGGQQ